MQKRFAGVAVFALVLMTVGTALPHTQRQLPLSPGRGGGLTVTPRFEGWYVNPDGSYSLSFGYYNRNGEEVLEIPLGENNFIEPAQFDGSQPTHFEPQRHWGVFAVRLPAELAEDARVVWTLKIRGETLAIPGHLNPDWQIDALEGEAGAGNTPPRIKFTEDIEAQGPLGIISGPLTAHVGEPLEVTVWTRDDGIRDPSIGTSGRDNVPVTLRWFKHQGPGDVTFGEPPTIRIPITGGAWKQTATFSEPGEYTLRVRANDASGGAGAGHAQCCWTNGFVKVTVTQ
jgi:hypothetical protein